MTIGEICDSFCFQYIRWRRTRMGVLARHRWVRMMRRKSLTHEKIPLIAIHFPEDERKDKTEEIQGIELRR